MSEQPAHPRPDEMRIRRAPRIGMFLLAGAVLGAVVTLALTLAFWTGADAGPGLGEVGFGARLAYFLVFGIPAGLVVGALVALVLDRMSSRSSRMVSVERIPMDGEGDPGDPAGEDGRRR